MSKALLEAAIEWGKEYNAYWVENSDTRLLAYFEKQNLPKLRRLVGAAENWLEWSDPKKKTADVEEMIRLQQTVVEQDRQIEHFQKRFEQQQVETVRLFDVNVALRSEFAEKERELKAYSNGALVYQDRVEELQRQRNEERGKAQEKERELERLRAGIFAVAGRTIGAEIVIHGIPTEAQVEKVAVELWRSSEVKGAERAWERIPAGEREAWCRAARRAIERGYKPEE